MNKDNLIEFAKEQCEIFPEDSYMGEYLRETLKMLQVEPCEDIVSREDVIKAVDRHTFDTDDGLCLDEDVSIIMEELPPVTPTQRWIPVSERLPKPYTFVNATCRSLVDDRENWVVETLYLPIPKENNEQGYSDWGDIPVLNWHKAEVIAWMERKIPEPYKESEEA
jgi:hypothetical protein